jgi:tight adherence protein B
MVSADLLAATCAVCVVATALGTLARVRRFARALRQAVTNAVEEDLADAFIFIDESSLRRGSALLAVAVAVVAYLAQLGLLASLAVATGLGFAPRLLLRLLRRQRQERLLRQLPDAIQSVAGLLKSGHSLGQALTTLAETQPRPLRNEWRLLTRRLRMGERPDAVFEQLPLRIEAPEARLLATTIRVSVDLGGSLAEALENLSSVLRRRLELQARIRAMTAQGRLQGIIVGCLPLLLLAVLSAIDAEAMQLLWSRPAGWAALGVLAALELCGFVMIRRIVRIDV